MQRLEVPRLDLMAIMRALPAFNDTTHMVELNLDIKEQYLPKYEYMNDNDGYPEGIIGHHLSWTAIGLIIIILCISIYSTNHVYLHRFSRLCDFAFKTQNAPCVSRFRRVLFSDRFLFEF